MAAEIILSYGTEYVATAEIPDLIAQALNPDASENPLTVSYFTKHARSGASGEIAEWNGRPTNDDDWKILSGIWANLPPVPDDATAEEIKPYLDAANASSTGLDWELGVCWRNPGLNASICRIDAEQMHRKALIAAIRGGKLKVVTPHTRLPTDEYQGNSEVATDELIRYVAQFQIDVRFAVLAGDLPEIWEQQKKAKIVAGRYTLEEAAAVLQQNTGERADEFCAKLVTAVGNGELATYEPGKQQRYKSKTVRVFYEEVYWCELNHWLAESEPRITWRFPEPNPDDNNLDVTDSKDGDTGSRQDGEPYLRKGKNSRAAVDAWVKWQATERVEAGDTGDVLAKRIELIAKKWGYESERTPLSVAGILRMLPAGITGGRESNKGRPKK